MAPVTGSAGGKSLPPPNSSLMAPVTGSAGGKSLPGSNALKSQRGRWTITSLVASGYAGGSQDGETAFVQNPLNTFQRATSSLHSSPCASFTAAPGKSQDFSATAQQLSIAPAIRAAGGKVCRDQMH